MNFLGDNTKFSKLRHSNSSVRKWRKCIFTVNMLAVKSELLTSTTGWMDLSFSHLNTVIQRSGEHTPNAVNMHTYGVHKYFILHEKKNTVKCLFVPQPKRNQHFNNASFSIETNSKTHCHAYDRTHQTAEQGLQKATCEKHDR